MRVRERCEMNASAIHLVPSVQRCDMEGESSCTVVAAAAVVVVDGTAIANPFN